MGNFVITIARGFGSGGKEIASAVAKDLGIHCYENRILSLASQLAGLDEAHFQEIDERLRPKALLGTLQELPRALNANPVTKNFMSDRTLFEYQAKIIRQLADTESCVIVGKCADFVLRDHENVFSFYIEAPRPYCRDNVVRGWGSQGGRRISLSRRSDKYRADYYKHYTGGNYWTNPVNYDLTLNAEKVGKDNCIKVIKSYVALRCGQTG